MTAVTIQCNKIVSNEVEDNSALPEPPCGEKTNELLGQPNNSVNWLLGSSLCWEHLERPLHSSRIQMLVTEVSPMQCHCAISQGLRLV